MTFILQNIRSGQETEFSITDILLLLGDPINDEIKIGKKKFRISSCQEISNGTGEDRQWVKTTLPVTANGQTIFNVQLNTSNLDGIFLVVNNFIYDHNTSFTISPTTLTWIGEFPLEISDSVYIKQLKHIPF